MCGFIEPAGESNSISTLLTIDFNEPGVFSDLSLHSFHNKATLKVASCTIFDLARLLLSLVPARRSLREIDDKELEGDEESDESLGDAESLSDSINVDIESVECCTYVLLILVKTIGAACLNAAFIIFSLF